MNLNATSSHCLVRDQEWDSDIETNVKIEANINETSSHWLARDQEWDTEIETNVKIEVNLNATFPIGWPATRIGILISQQMLR